MELLIYRIDFLLQNATLPVCLPMTNTSSSTRIILLLRETSEEKLTLSLCNSLKEDISMMPHTSPIYQSFDLKNLGIKILWGGQERKVSFDDVCLMPAYHNIVVITMKDLFIETIYHYGCPQCIICLLRKWLFQLFFSCGGGGKGVQQTSRPRSVFIGKILLFKQMFNYCC